MAAGGEVLNWSSTLEELLDDGKSEEAQQLLEGLVAQLEARPDAPTNLTLAAAFSDLASLYQSLGLSSKALSSSSAAILIKQTAQFLPPPPPPAVTERDHKLSVAPDFQEEQQETQQEERQEVLKQGSDCEEEWEALLCEGVVKLDGLSPAKSAPEILPREKTVYKQRGRGAFTHGEMGMHIDRPTSGPIKGREKLDVTTEAVDTEDDLSSPHSKVACGVRHVLVVSFPPSITIKDLEELFEPFGLPGVAIRWVNDTTALAVFRNPEVAKEALQNTKNPRFKLEHLTDDNTFLGLVSEQDLQPPVPRPATSSQAAHRMIMGALQRQGIHTKPSPASSFKSSQKQEAERKQRLLTRQKLRDEAWGSES